MKRFFSIAAAVLLVHSFSLNAHADDRREGIAQLELRSGGLSLMQRDENIAGLPAEFSSIGLAGTDFGQHAVTGAPMVLYSASPIGLIVQDARGLVSASSWRVTAQLSQFTETGNSVTLKGAQLVLMADPSTLVPTAAFHVPSMETVTLIPGAVSGTPVFRSNPSEGSPGVWGANWSAALMLPAEAEAGEHRAVLIWTLTAGE